MRPAALALLATLSTIPAFALDPSKTLTQYAHRIWGQEEGLFQPTIYSIAQTRDGFLWLGTQDSLIRFDGMRFRQFGDIGETAFQRSLIRALLEDRQGNLWVGSIGSGVEKISPNGTITRYTVKQGLPSDDVFCLASDSQDRIWICTTKGLVRLEHGRLRVFTTRDGLPNNQIRSTCEATDGTEWVTGLESGLSRWNGSRFELYLDPRLSVSALQCASDGSVWIGTDRGLTQIRSGESRSFSVRDGLPDNAVSSLAEGPDGSIWIGTNDGISRYYKGEICVYRVRDGLSHSLVLSLYVDREGSLWAGTKDGLDQFTDGPVTPYTTNDGMLSNDTGPVLEDAAGHLWVGTLGGGLSSFDGHRFRSITSRDGLRDDTILSLANGKDGDIWVGTKKGLNRIHNGRVVPTQTERQDFSGLELRTLPGVLHPVDCYYNDLEHHSQWMGTLGSGLLRSRDGTLSRIRVKDGLYDNRIYSILRDDNSNFWMASSKGIFRVSQKELEDFADGKISSVTSIPFSTGQLRFECQSGVQPAACRTRDGRLWFSTTNGLVVVDPNHLRRNTAPPPVQITAIIINGQRSDARQALQLKPFEKNVEIRYAGLSFVSPEKVTFRYILEGYDKTWTDAGPRREAFFTNLPPGTFRFKVMARNADGVWSTGPASLAFTIEPRLYQRPWFFPLLGIALAFAITAGYRIRIRQLKQRFGLVLSERSRIARELHDTLLQGLSGITMQLQALWTRLPVSAEKRFLGDIIKDAARCSSEARQSLWGLRGADSESLGFSQKLAELSRQAVSGRPISLGLQLQPVSRLASVEMEHELLRIAREAISNAVRHADATTLAVQLYLEDQELELVIEDDGTGFITDIEPQHAGHFGLLGMRERAQEIGAELTVTSSPGRGTRVVVRVPLSEFRVAKGNVDHPFEHQVR